MSDRSPSSTSGAMRGDIGTSYPSPISTAGSPNMEETSRQSFAEPQGQGRSDQHTLRSASVALQAAYRRIRQVVSLPDSFPGDIGPSHSALMLTASPVEESSDNDDALDFRAMRANLAAVDRQTQEYVDRFAPGSWGDHQQPSSNIDPPRPRRQVQLPSPSSSAEPLQQSTHPRRSMLESQLARRRELYNSDDPSTFLGRRVAAREAAGLSRAVDTPPQPPMDPILRAVEMEREVLHLRALAQQRRTDPGVAAASRADAMSRSEMIRAARSLDMESLRSAHRQQPGNNGANVPTHPRPPQNPHRWRAYRASAETRQNSNNTQPPASSHTDRLSILSNFSVQNLSTPTSAIARDRPLIFEEPLSYTGQRHDSRDIVESPIGSERSYFIHRRVNADGDELVHNINLEWDDEDPLSWLMSSRERGDSQDHSPFPRRRFAHPMFDAHERLETRGIRAPQSISEPRRRGWARLDPDGNAIPSDEEEELERSRAEYRVRALYQARASAAAVASRVERRAQSSIDVPGHPDVDNGGAFSITRTSISPDDYPARETSSPRVRLNSRDNVSAQRLGYGTVMDSVLAVDNRQTQSTHSDYNLYSAPYGSSEPFLVDPLPIPLSQMMPSKNEQKGRLTGIRVSRNAGFAGR
ncbi:hypothetical protein B0H19DRAFT_1136492 [Mycena capillaripes]|nr:hypothetical protein B0H19DRAFT_1136492 [Mycena capillaripes]